MIPGTNSRVAKFAISVLLVLSLFFVWAGAVRADSDALCDAYARHYAASSIDSTYTYNRAYDDCMCGCGGCR